MREGAREEVGFVVADDDAFTDAVVLALLVLQFLEFLKDVIFTKLCGFFYDVAK